MPGIRIGVDTSGAIRSLADFEKSLKDTGVAAKLSEKELEGLKNRFAEKLKADEAARELNKARESLMQLGKAANLSEKEMAAMAARMGISLDKVNRDVRGVTANVAHLERGFSGLAKRAAVTAAALVSIQGAVSFAGRSFNAWKEYESGLIDMGKVTDESITSIRKKIESLPASLGSSTELVRGYYQTISAGVTDADAAMDVLATSAKAAKAAHVSQDETIKVLTKTLAGFEGQVRSATEASDLLFSIEKLGQTSFSELVPVMGDLATVTRMVGVSHQELAAGMALLTQTSGSTAEAGTKWRGVMMGLFKPTENMAKMLESLGYESGQAMVAQLGLMGTLQTLERAARSGGTQLGKLFESSEALTGIAALGALEWERFAMMLGEVEKSVGGTERAVQGLKGSAEDAAKTWDATMANLAIKFGEELAPTMTAEMERFSKTVIDNKDPVVNAIGGIAAAVGWISNAIIGATQLFEMFSNAIAGGAAVAAGKLDFSDWAFSSPEELKAALQKAGEQHRREMRDAAITAGQQFGTIDLEKEFGIDFAKQAEKPKAAAPTTPVGYSAAESEELLKGTGTAVHQLNKAWSENLNIVSKLQSKIDSGKLSQEDLTRAVNDQREAWSRIADAQGGYAKKMSGGGGAAKAAQQAENFLESLNDQIAAAEAALSGDTLQTKLAQVDKRWNDFARRVDMGLAGAKLSAEDAAEAMARIEKGRGLETQAVEAKELSDALKRVADIMGDIADASGSPDLKIKAGMMDVDAWYRQSRQAIDQATQDEAQRAELVAALDQGVALKRLEVTRDAYEAMSAVSQKYWDAEKALIEQKLSVVKENADDELAYKIYAAQEWDDFNRRKLEAQANSPRSQGEAIQAVFALDSGSYKSDMGKLQDEWKTTAERMLSLSNDLSSGIAQGLGDALRGLASGDIKSFEEVWQSMLNRMLDSFISFLEDMLTEWLQKNVFGAMLGGEASGGGLLEGILGGGTDSSGGNSKGILGQLFDSLPDKIGDSVGDAFAPWVGGGFGSSSGGDIFSSMVEPAASSLFSASSALGAGISETGAAFGEAAITEMMGSMDVASAPWRGVSMAGGAGFSLGGALGGLGMGAGVGGMASSLFGGDSTIGSIGGAVGGLAGSFFGPVGAIVGGLIGGLAGLFGGGGDEEETTQVTGQGYSTMFVNNQSTSFGWESTATSSGGTVKDHGIRYTPLDPDDEAAIDEIFDVWSKNLFGAFEIFEWDKAAEGLASFNWPLFNWEEDQKDFVVDAMNNARTTKALVAEGIYQEATEMGIGAYGAIKEAAQAYSVVRDATHKAGLNLDVMASKDGDIAKEAEGLANRWGRSTPGQVPYQYPGHIIDMREHAKMFSMLAMMGFGGMIGMGMAMDQQQRVDTYTGGYPGRMVRKIMTPEDGNTVTVEKLIKRSDKEIGDIIDTKWAAYNYARHAMGLQYEERDYLVGEYNEDDWNRHMHQFMKQQMMMVPKPDPVDPESEVENPDARPEFRGTTLGMPNWEDAARADALDETGLEMYTKQVYTYLTAFAHSMPAEERIKTIGDIVEEKLTGSISGMYSAVQQSYEAVLDYSYQEMDEKYAEDLKTLIKANYAKSLEIAFGEGEEGDAALQEAFERYSKNTKSELESYATSVNYYKDTIRDILSDYRMETITDSELTSFIDDFWQQYEDMMTGGYVDPEDMVLWDTMAKSVEALDEAANAIEELGGALDSLRGISKASSDSIRALTDPYYSAKLDVKSWKKDADDDYEENMKWVDSISSNYDTKRLGLMGMDVHQSYEGYIWGYPDQEVTGEVQSSWIRGFEKTVNEYFTSAQSMAKDDEAVTKINGMQEGFRDTFAAMVDAVTGNGEYSAVELSTILKENLPQDMATALEKAMGLDAYVNPNERINITDEMIQGLEEGLADAIIEIDTLTLNADTVKSDLVAAQQEIMNAKLDEVTASWGDAFDSITKGDFGVWAEGFIAEFDYFSSAAEELDVTLAKLVELNHMRVTILDKKIDETLENYMVDSGDELQDWADDFVKMSDSVIAALREMGESGVKITEISQRLADIVEDKLNDALNNLASTYGYSRSTEMEEYMEGVMTDFHDAYEAAVTLGASEERLTEIRELEKSVISNKLKELMESIDEELAGYEDRISELKIASMKEDVPTALYDAALLGADKDQLNQIGMVHAYRVKEVYQQQIEEVAAKLSGVADALESLADTLEDYLEGLWTDFNMTPLEGPAVYTEAKKQWEDTVFNLGSDDIETREEAQDDIIDKTNSYLEASKRYNGDFAAYYEDFMRVQSILGETYENAKTEYELMKEQLDTALGIEDEVKSISELQAELADLQARQNATWEEMIAALPEQIETAMKNALAWKEKMEAAISGSGKTGDALQKLTEQWIMDDIASQKATNTYLADKAAMLNEQGYEGRTDWTMDAVLEAMMNAGMTPAMHYLKYGQDEGLSWSDPNITATGTNSHSYNWDYFDQDTGWTSDGTAAAYIDPVNYGVNKADQLNSIGYGGRTDWTASQVLQTFADNGMTAAQHYAMYGQYEGIKPYAAGGYINAGQLALVGEEGPELVQFDAPARIYNHTQTANMAGAEYADLKAELAALRREMAAGNRAIAENTQKTAKTLEKFDYDGLPAERTEA